MTADLVLEMNKTRSIVVVEHDMQFNRKIARTVTVFHQGKILAQAKGKDELVTADIDPSAGRSGGDSMNFQGDMRSRIFHRRSSSSLAAASPRPKTVKTNDVSRSTPLKRFGKNPEPIRPVEFLDRFVLM